MGWFKVFHGELHQALASGQIDSIWAQAAAAVGFAAGLPVSTPHRRGTPNMSLITPASGSAKLLTPSWPRKSAPSWACRCFLAKVKRFSNDCIEVQLQANCREQDVF